MKISLLSSTIFLSLACLLAGCVNRPRNSSQPNQPAAQATTTPQQHIASHRELDEAGKILVEEIIRSANSNTQRPVTIGEQVGATGKPLISYGGGFAVTPPPGLAPFAENISKVNDGQTELHTFGPNGPIVIAYTFISDEETNEPTQQVLGKMRDATLRPFNSALEKQEFLTVEGHPAISFYFLVTDSKNRVYFHNINIINGHRIYQISYSAFDRAELDRPDVQAFFSSFKFLN